MTDYSTGGSLKLAVTNEKDVTLDFVVSEADAIYKKCRAEKLKFGDREAAEKQMSQMRKEHPEFCKSYPIVLRYMCEMQEYKTKAFRKYLLKIQEHPWKNQDEYLDSQADYVCLLYMETKKRWTRTAVENIRRNIRKMLQHEHETFMKYSEAFNSEVTAEEEIRAEHTTETLREFYSTYGEEAVDVPVRTVSEIAPRAEIDLDALVGGETTEQSFVSTDDLLSD